MNTEHPVAVVTGGTRGLGHILVNSFMERGYRVASLSRTPSANPSPSDNLWYLVADVTQPDAVARAGEEITKQWGRVDVWINNAGFGRKVPFLVPNPSPWNEVFNTNVWGTIHGCRTGLRLMMEHGSGGAVINIASLAALMACPDHSAYCTAKATIIALTRSLAIEFAAARIRVNAIAPGPLDTDGFRAAGGDPVQRAKAIPTRTMVSPGEVAAACLFLAEPLTSLTGHTLVIDGGSAAIGCYA